MFGFGGSKSKEEEKAKKMEYKEDDLYNKFNKSDSNGGSSSITMPTGNDMVSSMGTTDLGKKS